MDKIEARAILESMKLIDFRFAPKSKTTKALDLAIEALQEPTEEVDYCNNCPYISWDKDCISRQQAIEALTGWQTEPLDEDIVRTLDNLPAVVPDFETFCGVPIEEAIEVLEKYKHSPTERTGEWIEHDPKTKGLAKIYECPFCGDEVIGEKTNYCPNCGAKMKGQMI